MSLFLVISHVLFLVPISATRALPAEPDGERPGASQGLVAPDWTGWFFGNSSKEQQGKQDKLQVIDQALRNEAHQEDMHQESAYRITTADEARTKAKSDGTDWGAAQPEGDNNANTDCEDWCHEPPGTAPPRPATFLVDAPHTMDPCSYESTPPATAGGPLASGSCCFDPSCAACAFCREAISHQLGGVRAG